MQKQEISNTFSINCINFPFDKGQTPGHRLMGVRLGQPSRLQAAIRYLLMVMLPTLLAEGLPLPGFFQRALERLSLALRIFDLFHYVLWFLGRGGPMSLVDRLLGVQTVYIHSAPSLGINSF
jgi:hypothetical protein